MYNRASAETRSDNESHITRSEGADDDLQYNPCSGEVETREKQQEVRLLLPLAELVMANTLSV